MSTSCCSLSPQERDRNLANAIRGRADGFLGSSQLAEASKLLVAARTLLEASGGIENEPGVWLLTSEANLLALTEEPARALTAFHSALALAEKVLGEEHEGTAVCVCNVAESNLKCGKAAAAKPLIQRAIAILTSGKELSPGYTAEYVQAVLAQARELEADIQKAVESEQKK